MRIPTILAQPGSELRDGVMTLEDNDTHERPVGTILAVEDEALLLDVLTAELEDYKYRVLQAPTGEVALSILRDNFDLIDLLVTDIRLPGPADGWTVAEEARRLRPDLPVIYVTGYAAQSHREVPGSVIIPKPYRAAAIAATAKKLGVSTG